VIGSGFRSSIGSGASALPIRPLWRTRAGAVLLASIPRRSFRCRSWPRSRPGLVINPRLPVRAVAELIAFAKANPGKITAATQGKGTTSHLTSEWFQIAAGVKFVQVPYRGSAPALQGMVAGDVDIMFDNLGISLALATSGQLRLIAVATPARLPSLPDLPTVAETLPALVSSTWVGAFLPPNTPRAIADRLSADFAQALRQPDIVQRFRDHGCEPVGGTPEATADFVRNEAALWKRVIADAGITAE
jgi:tripartite-type tricarboxylate transporter receptor subunit TctC